MTLNTQGVKPGDKKLNLKFTFLGYEWLTRNLDIRIIVLLLIYKKDPSKSPLSQNQRFKQNQVIHTSRFLQACASLTCSSLYEIVSWAALLWNRLRYINHHFSQKQTID